MKYKIIVDSSSDLRSDYIVDKDIGFSIAPLTINVNGVDYIDDDSIDTDELLKNVNESKVGGKSSCPSPYEFQKGYDDADYIVVVTISSKMSGSYNSAIAGIAGSVNKNVIVIDSKSTAGTLVLIVDEAYRLMKEDKLSFEELEVKLNEFRDSLTLLFILNKFDNLVKNGRMNKIVAMIATKLLVKPLCIAEDGQIKILEKIRTIKGAFKRLVNSISRLCSKPEDRVLIITHVKAETEALELKQMIEEHYNFKEIRIMETKGLCSFYALEQGILVSF